jgi:hypothetical protein
MRNSYVLALGLFRHRDTSTGSGSLDFSTPTSSFFSEIFEKLRKCPFLFSCPDSQNPQILFLPHTKPHIKISELSNYQKANQVKRISLPLSFSPTSILKKRRTTILWLRAFCLTPHRPILQNPYLPNSQNESTARRPMSSPCCSFLKNILLPITCGCSSLCSLYISSYKSKLPL